VLGSLVVLRGWAWRVRYELAAGEVGARPAHRDFLPWRAAVGGCKLPAWLGVDVQPPARVPEGDKRFADPAWGENLALFAVRQGYLAASQLVGDPLAAGAGEAKARLATGFLLGALARHRAIADATGGYVPG